MENRSQKPFVLIFVLACFILTLQFIRWPDFYSATLLDDHHLLGPASQHPHLLFQAIPVNTANAYQFVVIPGIGSELSRRIVSYRDKHGPFLSLEELGGVNGIGPRKLATMKPYCRL